MKRKNSLIAWSAIGLAMLSLLPVSCKKESEKSNGPYYNAKHITDENKVAMIHSLKDLDGTGRLFEINYDVDYKLDQVLASNIGGTQALFEYIAYLLYDDLGSKVPEVKYGAGCSAFAVDEKAGKDRLMGRNYDFRHFASDGETLLPTSAILVRTAPKGGKKSISMVDGINLGYGKGFLYDENTDLSLLMGLPYAALDGINEDGFAIGVLALREKPTVQSKEGQGKIATTVAIRMLLDHDSIQYVQVNNVYVYPQPVFKNAKERMAYNRLVYNIKKVLPIAKEVRKIIIETGDYLETLPNKRAANAW